jgi:hypothetical protein
MIRFLTSLLIILIATICYAAPVEKPIEVFIATGGGFPTSDFNLNYNFGFNGSVGLGFRLIPHFRLVTKLEYQAFNLDNNAFTDTVNGGNFGAFMAGIDLRFAHKIPHWPVDPLLLVGGGISYSSVSQLTIGSDVFDAQTETKPYLNIGLGLVRPVSKQISVFVIGRYVRISSGGTKTEFFPITIGIRFPS